MRQFILTVGTIVAALACCWHLYLGIAAVIQSQLSDSLYYLFLIVPLLASQAVAFDYVNVQLHSDYRKFRKSLARKKGAQIDIYSPSSQEVEETPWEDDSSHTH